MVVMVHHIYWKKMISGHVINDPLMAKYEVSERWTTSKIQSPMWVKFLARLLFLPSWSNVKYMFKRREQNGGKWNSSSCWFSSRTKLPLSTLNRDLCWSITQVWKIGAKDYWVWNYVPKCWVFYSQSLFCNVFQYCYLADSESFQCCIQLLSELMMLSPVEVGMNIQNDNIIENVFLIFSSNHLSDGMWLIL